MRHFSTSGELYKEMEQKRLEACFNINDQDSIKYDKERALTLISIPIYQVHTQDLMLLRADTGAPISYIGSHTPKRIFQLLAVNPFPWSNLNDTSNSETG